MKWFPRRNYFWLRLKFSDPQFREKLQTFPNLLDKPSNVHWSNFLNFAIFDELNKLISDEQKLQKIIWIFRSTIPRNFTNFSQFNEQSVKTSPLPLTIQSFCFRQISQRVSCWVDFPEWKVRPAAFNKQFSLPTKRSVPLISGQIFILSFPLSLFLPLLRLC